MRRLIECVSHRNGGQIDGSGGLIREVRMENANVFVFGVLGWQKRNKGKKGGIWKFGNLEIWKF